MITIGTDSYVSLAEANEYFAAKLYADAWTNAADDLKEKALKEAARMMNQYRYRGSKVSDAQELAFPRVLNAITLSDAERILYSTTLNTVPKDVKYAQMEQAYYLLDGKDEAREMASKGVQSFSAGGASLSLRDDKYALLSPIAKHYLTPYFSVTGVIV